MLKSPKEIYDHLDKKVSSQDEAKKVLANEVFKHTSRFFYNLTHDDQILNKSICLLTGPTGCGKTYLVDCLEEACQFPVFKIDATSLSKSGYKGTNIDEHIKSCYDQYNLKYKHVNFNKQVAMEYAIIFIDEIDKICVTPVSDGWNKELQYSLLTVLQGIKVAINQRVMLDTSNILFILGGNFKEIRFERNKRTKPSIGFTQQFEKPLTEHEELTKCGMIDELAGRVAKIVELKPLTKKELKEILVKKESSILKQYEKLFDYIGYEVRLSKHNINTIVNNCHKNNTGARGLQVELDKFLEKHIFEMQVDWSDYVKDVK